MRWKNCLAAGLAVTTVLSVQVPALGLDLLRSVPLEISAYEVEAGIPPTLSDAAQVLDLLNGNRNLLVHMEVIRRAYTDLPPEERQKLLEELFGRYQALDDDAVRFFDHGYAQLVFEENQTGLFFLRKANDAIKDQFSSLAYAMAQAEADLNHENRAPDEMTTRKMDVMYKLKDAAIRDAGASMAGFWPSFVRVTEKLKDFPAYASVKKTDYSVKYVPYGNSVLPLAMSRLLGDGGRIDLVGASGAGGFQGCEISRNRLTPPDEMLYTAKHVDLLGTGDTFVVKFFRTDEADEYRVRVLNPDQQVIGAFTSSVAPYIIEDLEEDGKYEFVIRQHKTDPYHPVVVYRLSDDGCAVTKDETVSAYFE